MHDFTSLFSTLLDIFFLIPRSILMPRLNAGGARLAGILLDLALNGGESLDDGLDQIDVGPFDVDDAALLLQQSVELSGEDIAFEVEI